MISNRVLALDNFKMMSKLKNHNPIDRHLKLSIFDVSMKEWIHNNLLSWPSTALEHHWAIQLRSML